MSAPPSPEAFALFAETLTAHEPVVLPAGRDWDAVRTAEHHGEQVLRLLYGDASDPRIGCIAADRDCWYWFIRPGYGAEPWPIFARHLGTGAYLTLPVAHRPCGERDFRGTRWVRSPGAVTRPFTDAVELCTALGVLADTLP
ncbi:hypothetical protein [Streptomyces aidingensis]|uniref:Uncharacterized protein n=1 Tax=Streptomyces aidingensis TaxID=910347 RepID=A0A1I1K817_9ACTN|nr:hypothetical protein [Streptomyces aidingensis]SFC57049.1 hypothetical protein SAMN05421773_104127 [Streptomyces aidingensis]